MELKNFNLDEAEIYDENNGCVFENDGTISNEELMEGDIFDEEAFEKMTD